MALVERADPADHGEVERLVAELHAEEGMPVRRGRIAWAVDQQVRNRFPGLVLVAREEGALVGAVLAAYLPSAELGRVLVVQDFYVVPASRRTGVGRALAARLLDEAKAMRIDRIDLEVLPTNVRAAAFWTAVGFRTTGRTVYGRDVG
ncbi:MAG: GNAT family N-acetyltransferase [Methanobacteriota archaeon]